MKIDCTGWRLSRIADIVTSEKRCSAEQWRSRFERAAAATFAGWKVLLGWKPLGPHAGHVGVAAAWTAGSIVVDSQLDFAQRACTLDHQAYGCLGLLGERLFQRVTVFVYWDLLS